MKHDRIQKKMDIMQVIDSNRNKTYETKMWSSDIKNLQTVEELKQIV